MGKENIIEEFLEATPIWLKSLGDFTQCPGCGLRPVMMEKLVEEIKILKEKAWKYDDLSS